MGAIAHEQAHAQRPGDGADLLRGGDAVLEVLFERERDRPIARPPPIAARAAATCGPAPPATTDDDLATLEAIAGTPSARPLV